MSGVDSKYPHTPLESFILPGLPSDLRSSPVRAGRKRERRRSGLQHEGLERGLQRKRVGHRRKVERQRDEAKAERIRTKRFLSMEILVAFRIVNRDK